MSDDFKTTFHAFCDASKKGSTTATDKTVKKICTDAKLKLDQNLVDIELRKFLGNTKKDMNCGEFENFVSKHLVPLYCKSNKGADAAGADEEIKKKICANGPKAHGATKSSADDATKRLTDVKGYTGAHKERFDESGKGKGIEGRKEIADGSGYVGNYKGANTYDKTH